MPEYICQVARAIKRSGKSTSQAIAIAVSRIKKWAAGAGGVDADTRAKAAKALAQWEKLKAKSKGDNKKTAMSNPLFLDSESMSDADLLTALATIGPCHGSATNQILLSIQPPVSAVEQLLAAAKKRR